MQKPDGEFAKAVSLAPILQFPRGWRVKLLPCKFTSDGEICRFRIYRRGTVVSVIGWRDKFELYCPTTMLAAEVSYLMHRESPSHIWWLAGKITEKQLC